MSKNKINKFKEVITSMRSLGLLQPSIRVHRRIYSGAFGDYFVVEAPDFDHLGTPVGSGGNRFSVYSLCSDGTIRVCGWQGKYISGIHAHAEAEKFSKIRKFRPPFESFTILKNAIEAIGDSLEARFDGKAHHIIRKLFNGRFFIVKRFDEVNGTQTESAEVFEVTTDFVIQNTGKKFNNIDEAIKHLSGAA